MEALLDMIYSHYISPSLLQQLVTPDDEWLYKNRDCCMLSAAGSLGIIQLWNLDEGLSMIDKFLYSTEDYVKAGTALAVGILSSGIP